MSRDNFTQATKRRLAERVGFMCCYPGCLTPHTIGPAKGHDGVINLGNAAHITAASEDGPRFDKRLTPEQRRSKDNGIWMCTAHAKAIDSDEASFDVVKLKKWKQEAEDRALKHVWTRQVLERPDFFSDEQTPEALLIASLELDPITALQDVVSSIRNAAARDIETYRAPVQLVEPPISLTLRSENGEQATFSVEKLADALEAIDEVLIVAGPGVGKTTTLIQCAEAILAADNLIPVFVNLPNWSVQPETLFRSIANRLAFSGYREGHFKLMAAYGRLVLILDGWNQLDALSRRRVTVELMELRRQYTITVVISSRRQTTDAPVDGMTVSIQPLSEAQQDAMAVRVRGTPGVHLLQNARRTRGIADLLATPLYLDALLRSTDQTVIPTTKEELLRLFVKQHERSFLDNEALKATFEFPDEVLQDLAVDATRNANTTLAGDHARALTTGTQKRLHQAGQIATFARPQDILDSLVSHHLLLVDSAGNFSFQHQQFQEWFASKHVERILRGADAGDESAQHDLRQLILNYPGWEEAFLFAAIRASRDGDRGPAAVAYAVRQALTIDPMLAAEAIYRSDPSVWHLVDRDITGFAKAWHTPGTVDRAIAFMLNTAQSEFAATIWPFLESADDQVFHTLLRSPRRFRPSSLGASAMTRILGLPAPAREAILWDLIFQGGEEGKVLAKAIACVDSSDQVKEHVIQALIFRNRDNDAAEVLNTASEAAWKKLSRDKFIREIEVPDVADKLSRLFKEDEEATAGANAPLVALLMEPRSKEIGFQIAHFIASSEFDTISLETRPQISDAYNQYPADVIRALVQRLTTGLPILWQTDAYLSEAAITTDSSEMLITLRSDATPKNVKLSAAKILGSHVVGELLADIIRSGDQNRHASNVLPKVRELQAIRAEMIELSPEASFVDAVIHAFDQFGAEATMPMLSSIARHGHEQRPKPFSLEQTQKSKFIEMIEQWAAFIRTTLNDDRRVLAALAKAISRVPDPSLFPLVRTMLEKDLVAWQIYRDKFLGGDRSDFINSEARSDNTWNYKLAFGAIGGDPVVKYLFDLVKRPEAATSAAAALVEIWQANQESPSTTSKSFTRFSDVAAARVRRTLGVAADQSFANAIFAAIAVMLHDARTRLDSMRLLQMAQSALLLPHQLDIDLFDELLKLPNATYERLRLVEQLAIAGHILPARYVLDSIEDLFRLAEDEPWLLREDRGELQGWVSLAPLTDQPLQTTMAAIDRLERGERQDAQWRRRLLETLSALPSKETEQILLHLATEDLNLAHDYGWLEALIKHDSEDAYTLLLEFLQSGATSGAAGGRDHFRVAGYLSSGVGKFPDFRQKVYDTLLNATNPNIISTLMDAVSKSGDANGVLCLIRKYALLGQPYDWQLARAIEQAVVGQRLIDGSSNAYNTYSLPASDLRRTLFEMAADHNSLSTLATQALTKIDWLRDEHGQVETEPRHPFIESGLPWPMVDYG